MRVKAVVGFAGQVCAASGEVLDLPDSSPVLADLLRAGYVEPEEEQAPVKKSVPRKPKPEG